MTTHDDQDPAELFEELTDGQRIVFHVSAGAAGLEGRPLTVAETTAPATVRFLVDRTSDWVDSNDVLLGFSDGDDGRWVSASGTQRLVTDSAEKERLWNPLANAWFDGADDPNLAVLEVQVERFAWWDSSSNKLLRMAKIAVAAATGGDAGDDGDHGVERV